MRLARTLTALGALLALGCATLFATRIAAIKQDPREYDGKVVVVSGRVTQSMSILGLRYFVVDDGSGEITVVTERAVPQKGESVRVRGRVEQAFAIAGRSLIVILEQPPDR